jgi:site-specific recombinase XerD
MEKMNRLFSLIRDFLISYLPNERKCSSHTIRSYQKALELLLDYIKTNNNVTLSKVTFEMIDRNSLSAFLNYLETERGCGVTTRNHRLYCIRAFYTYAAESDITVMAHLEEISKVDTATVAEKLVEHMSETAVDAVISTPDTLTLKGLRDMFLMLLLFRTGARIQELLDIKLRDITFGTSPSVMLYGKGAKVRAVPLRNNTVEHLKSYINLFHPDESGYSEQFLFYVIRNQSKKRMTEDNARDLIHKYGATARKTCLEVPEKVV